MGQDFTGTEIAASIIEETKREVDLRTRIRKREYRQRWEMVQSAMLDREIDLVYACGSELDRSDAAWLAGVFDPIIERYGVMVPKEGAPAILAGSEGGHVLEEAADRSGAEIYLLREFQISDEEYRHAHFTSLEKVLESMGAEDADRVAIASSPEFLPLSQYELLKSRFGDGVVFDNVLQPLKYEKTHAELRVCGQANVIADAAMRAMIAALEPGVTELEVAGIGDFVMKELGAGRTGFPTIVTAGERNYTVIGPATNNVIEEDDMVSLGLSPTFNGYHGVVRRTVKVGDPTRDQERFLDSVEDLYRVVIDATAEAAEHDLPAKHIDQAGKEFLSKLELSTVEGSLETPLEPYTFIHNTGCSECQEGFGAVTPHSDHPLGHSLALMIDIALLGFRERGKPLFEVHYAVIEDAFWKMDTRVGVYNSLPLNVQSLVGNLDDYEHNPYHCPLPTG